MYPSLSVHSDFKILIFIYPLVPHRGSISSKMKRRVSSAMAKISYFSHTTERRNSNRK